MPISGPTYSVRTRLDLLHTSMPTMGSSVFALFSSCLLAGQALGYGAGLARRQASTKFCDTGVDGVCLAQYATSSSASGIVFRLAIPQADAAPFDVLLSIIAPVSAGWAGLAWGGSMTANPLTVAWPNGDAAVVSSRWAT